MSLAARNLARYQPSCQHHPIELTSNSHTSAARISPVVTRTAMCVLACWRVRDMRTNPENVFSSG